jgi:hypothetical protein
VATLVARNAGSGGVYICRNVASDAVKLFSDDDAINCIIVQHEKLSFLSTFISYTKPVGLHLIQVPENM